MMKCFPLQRLSVLQAWCNGPGMCKGRSPDCIPGALAPEDEEGLGPREGLLQHGGTVLPPLASSLFSLPERIAEPLLLLWQKHVFAFASLVLLSVCFLFVF